MVVLFKSYIQDEVVHTFSLDISLKKKRNNAAGVQSHLLQSQMV